MITLQQRPPISLVSARREYNVVHPRLGERCQRASATRGRVEVSRSTFKALLAGDVEMGAFRDAPSRGLVRPRLVVAGNRIRVFRVLKVTVGAEEVQRGVGMQTTRRGGSLLLGKLVRRLDAKTIIQGYVRVESDAPRIPPVHPSLQRNVQGHEKNGRARGIAGHLHRR